MNNYIKHIVEDFEFNAVNQKETSADKIIDLLNLQNITVDLGLPSKTLWCKYNLGCNYDLLNNYSEQTEPEDWYGDYYAWGETQPNKSKRYTWETYKFKKEIIKYNDTDKLTELLPEDDAAYKNIHIGNYKFHIPTVEQINELIKYTDNEWVNDYNNINGLNGRLYISKINNKQLFIPAAGYYYDSMLYDDGFCYCFWSSSIDNLDSYYIARDLYFNYFNSDLGANDSNHHTVTGSDRYYGQSIRGIINL